MKKLFGALLIVCAVVFCLAGCEEKPLEFSENKVAMITDYGDITDQSFNQATYEGCKEYCDGNSVAFKYYKPASNSDADRVKSIETAIEEGYNIIVMPGYAFAPAIAEVSVKKLYQNVKFVALDVSEYDLTTALAALETPVTEIPANVWSAVYQEELCGFFAGYAAVKAGYKKLGFLGGMAVPAVVRYGLGFVQGVKKAAEELSLNDVTVEYQYGGQFFGDADITAVMDTWYTNKGVEIVFACGGGIYTSACEAAQKLENGGALIGVDVDQRATVEAAYSKVNCLTSAMKGLAATVKATLNDIIKNNKFEGGQIVTLGLVSSTDLDKNYVGIPTASASWKFGTSFTVDEYKALVAKVMGGQIVVNSDITAVPATEGGVTVNYVAQSIK